MSVKIIEALTFPNQYERMKNTTAHQVLVLGATGKTGSRVAERLSAHDVSVRTAARSGADARFDWDNQATWEQTLRGATGLYLVSPILRIDFAGLVGRFLDQAERAGVRHVTYLSAYGMEHAPAEVALRAVELDLAARGSLTSTVIRPAWFMEDFSETFLQPVNDEIVVPAGDGAEAFVSVEDIAAVAAVTLTEPEGARRARLRPDRPAGAHHGRGRRDDLGGGGTHHHLPGHRPRGMDRRYGQLRRAGRVRPGPALPHRYLGQWQRRPPEQRCTRRHRHGTRPFRRVRRQDRSGLEVTEGKELPS
jgi:hypothetical protein